MNSIEKVKIMMNFSINDIWIIQELGDGKTKKSKI